LKAYAFLPLTRMFLGARLFDNAHPWSGDPVLGAGAPDKVHEWSGALVCRVPFASGIGSPLMRAPDPVGSDRASRLVNTSWIETSLRFLGISYLRRGRIRERDLG
jgi:hypothetical protein